MGVRDFAISTNHPFNQYQPGQTVRGKIHFKLHSSKIIRGVYVNLKGLANVSWEESETEERDNKTVTTYTTYHADHEYFNENIYVIGAPNGDSFELQSGEHNFKFQYNLPIGLPTSFEGNLGNIYYSATAVIDIPWRIDEKVEAKLEIWSPIDLNLKQHLKYPAHRTESKYLCCLWCRSGPISLEINISKTGYACGEALPIVADIENLSNTKITMVEFKMQQKVTYHSEYPRPRLKELAEPLCFIRLPGTSARSVQTYNEKLTIPKGADLNFDGCNLFDIEHKLKVKLFIDGCHSDLRVEIPVTLGSIPFKQNMAPVVSILAGLGTPYPHETSGNSREQRASYLLNNEYGWMMSSEANVKTQGTSE